MTQSFGRERVASGRRGLWRGVRERFRVERAVARSVPQRGPVSGAHGLLLDQSGHVGVEWM